MRRFTAFLIGLLLSSAVLSGEKGELGLRLKHEGLAWRIVGISPDGEAARAGLQVGDVVIQINNLFLPSEDQLLHTVAGLKPGNVIEVSVLDRLGAMRSYPLRARATSD